MYNELPLVELEYPDSSTNHQKVRFVRVTKMDENYVEGFELDHPYSTSPGKFKRFCKSRIVRNGVALLQFSPE